MVSEHLSRRHSVSHWTTWQALRGEWSQLSGVRSGFTTMSWKYNIKIICFELGIRSYLFLASFEHNRAGWCHWQAPDEPFWGVQWLVENCSRWYVTCWWIKREKMWRQIRTSWLFIFKVNHQGCYARQDMRIIFFSQRCKNNIVSFGQDIRYFPRNSSAKLLHALHAVWQSSLFTMSLYLFSTDYGPFACLYVTAQCCTPF